MRRELVYDVDDRPPAGEGLALGAQHLVAMLLGNITPPLLIAGALGLAAGQTGLLVQAVLLVAGLSTLVQAYPMGPVGGRIPIVMGTSIAFVGASIAIGSRAGLAAVFGACLAAAVVEVVIGFSFSRVRRWFPPLVTSVVVMLIGLTLIPVGVDYAAGGMGAEDYGSVRNLGIAAVVLLATLALNQYATGLLAHASVLAGVGVGYALSVGVGVVDFSAVSSAGWLSAPRPLPFGLRFEWSAVLIMAFIYVVSSIETIGDITGVIAAAGREPTDRELKGGLVADGASSGMAALFGAFPTTSYSQNVGLVNFTGVVSRHVTAVTGALLVLLGLVPKISASLATIPPAVIGGAGLVMFSMIFASGAAIFRRSVPLTQRSLVILAIAVGLGLGVELRPEALHQLPEGVRNFFGTGLITGGLAALLLNAILPDQASDES